MSFQIWSCSFPLFHEPRRAPVVGRSVSAEFFFHGRDNAPNQCARMVNSEHYALTGQLLRLLLKSRVAVDKVRVPPKQRKFGDTKAYKIEKVVCGGSQRNFIFANFARRTFSTATRHYTQNPLKVLPDAHASGVIRSQRQTRGCGLNRKKTEI